MQIRKNKNIPRKKKPFPKAPVFKNPVTTSGFFTSDLGDEVEVKPGAQKGRGAVSSQMSSRFERFTRHRIDDGWQKGTDENGADPDLDADADALRYKTILTADSSRSVIARNDSPDLGFSQSINPYRGCEHGCVYCFARPSHAYLGLSPGLDFETRIFYKPKAAELLRAELAKPSYKLEHIMIGINTDCYQPSERKLGITRGILQVMAETSHPCSLITKSALILRDLDILAPMAKKGLVRVAVTLGTLNGELHRKLEPRAPRPEVRLNTLRELAKAGVPTTIMVAPIIPAINDHEIEALLEAAKDAGVKFSGHVVLRLPYELKGIFDEWLSAHFPDRKAHVLSLLKQIYGGKLYDANWEVRGWGKGAYAQMLHQRHRKACEKLGLNTEDRSLNHDLFRKPPADARQGQLF